VWSKDLEIDKSTTREVTVKRSFRMLVVELAGMPGCETPPQARLV